MQTIPKSKVVEIIRRATFKAGSQKAFAVTAGLSPAYVNDVLQHRRDPADAILEAVGLERDTVYRRKPSRRRRLIQGVS